MKNFKVFHFVRSISYTSMPWNDLYFNHRKINYKNAGFFIAFRSFFGLRKKRFPTSNSNQIFFDIGFLSLPFFVIMVFMHSRKRSYIPIFHIMIDIFYVFFRNFVKLI